MCLVDANVTLCRLLWIFLPLLLTIEEFLLEADEGAAEIKNMHGVSKEIRK